MSDSRKRANESTEAAVTNKLTRVDLICKDTKKEKSDNKEIVSQLPTIKEEPLSPTQELDNQMSVAHEPVVLKVINKQLATIKKEPVTPPPRVSYNQQSVDPDDDEPLRGIEEFNANYLKRDPQSPYSNSDVNSPLAVDTLDGNEVEQSGAGRFKIIEQQSAHENYLSTTIFQPTKPTGHLLHTFADLEQPLTEHITAFLAEHHGIKVFLVMDVNYESIIDSTKEFSDHLHTHFFPIFSVAEIPQFLNVVNQELIIRNENFVQFKSGLRLKNISQVTLSAAEHQPIAGSSYNELPPFLANKKCTINVKNRDNRCFGYALLASLEPSAHNQNNPRSYNQHFAKHPLDSLTYPVKPSDIPAIESNLPFAINVFGFDDDVGRSRFPIYVSPKTDLPVIDLIYWNEHYALITKFNTFLCDIKKFTGHQQFCRRCFGNFWKESALVNHQRYCLGFNGCKTNIRMPPENSKCEFKNIKNQLKCPFVIYADFECLLPPNPTQAGARPGKTVPTQKHIPFSVGFKLVGPDLRTQTNQDPTLDYSNYAYDSHTGPHCAEWLLVKLMKLESTILKVLFNDQRMVMIDEDIAAFETASDCHICKKGWELDDVPVRRACVAVENMDSEDDEFGRDEEEEQAQQPRTRKWQKVRDHDHLTGRFRGAAHNHCNWQYRKQLKIPVFFHNLKNYDGHLIIRAMEKVRNYQIKPIAQGLEKYLIICWGKHLVFKDTLQFMATSLEHLATNLLNKGREHFVHLHRGFNETPARMDLILRKGVFPYDYMCNFCTLNCRLLPSQQHFYSKLKQSECSVEDSLNAQTVWHEFGCQTMKDYSELYIKTGMLKLSNFTL